MNRTPNWQLALDVINQLHILVFPCREKNISFRSNGRIINRKAKSPYTKNGYKDATTSLEKVDQLWAKNQHAMVAVPMGSASGIFAIDIDEGTNKSGEATFTSLGLEEPKTFKSHISLLGGRVRALSKKASLEVASQLGLEDEAQDEDAFLNLSK